MRFLFPYLFNILIGLVAAGGAFAETSAALGLPASPQDSPARRALGERLFFDARLSGDGKISCASCHQPKLAFSDGLQFARGIAQQEGTRNTPSILNTSFNTSQFWEGRRPSLETQALDPLTNPREHGLKDHAALIKLLKRDKTYVRAFQAAFDIRPEQIAIEHVTHALASFERTLLAGDSAFDRYYFKGDKTSLSPSAERGLNLFRGPARCSSCHTMDEKNALFTDNQFHRRNVGAQQISDDLAAVTTYLVKANASSNSPARNATNDASISALGRFAVTLNPADIGKFRTPSLRNVALTAPYMHNGSLPTLEAVVEWELYYGSEEGGPPLVLTPAEIADLIEFLKALSSPAATMFVRAKQNPDAK